MPNIVYAKDTRDAVVPGDLTLRGVTPVQALALAAAAADCMLEPIYSPAGETDEGGGFGGASSDSQSPPIIGYRIALTSSLNRVTSPATQQLAELTQQLAAARSSLGEKHPDRWSRFASASGIWRRMAGRSLGRSAESDLSQRKRMASWSGTSVLVRRLLLSHSSSPASVF